MPLFSYWILPVVAATVWFVMLLSMLLVWITSGRPHYVSMDPNQKIAMISDVGADFLKPWFITGSVITTIGIDSTLLAEWWLRRSGRLVRTTSTTQKVFASLAFITAVIGTVGLICLSIFDTKRHPSLHRLFLLFFIAGYLLSAIFICVENQRLGIHFRQFKALRAAFWMKLIVIIVEIGLCIGFVVTLYTHQENKSAIFEWTIAFVFTFYILSFLPDLLPAIRTKPGELKEEPMIERGETHTYHERRT